MKKKSHSRRINKQEAAALLGISTRHLQDLTSRGVIPCVRDNRKIYYDASTLQAAYDARPNARPRSANLEVERERLTRLKADRQERLLKKELGEVVRVEDLRHVDRILTERFMNLLKPFPDQAVTALRCANAKHPGHIQEVLRVQVYALLNALVHIADNLEFPKDGER
jgi:phage terminase Nu1 subunit (DNA packaging protein)